MDRSVIAATLRQHGLRHTPQRAAILLAFHQTPGHLEAQEILQRSLSHVPTLNEATVYRNLDVMVRAGVLQRCLEPDGQVVFELSGEHHHIICQECGGMLDIAHAVISEALEPIQKKTGFTINTHHLILYGTCPGCQAG